MIKKNSKTFPGRILEKKVPRKFVERERKMGLRDIETKIRRDRAWQQKRVDLLLDDLEEILNNRSNLKIRLKDFETKYHDLLGTFPTIAHKIQQLKEAAGIAEPPPMEIKSKPSDSAIPSSRGVAMGEPENAVAISNCPTLWERLLGRGPFYSQLALKILEIGESVKQETGGLIRLGELVLQVNKGRSMHDLIDIKDIEKALRRLEKDQLIPGLRQIPSGEWIVEFTPTVLDQDVINILGIASRKGWVSLEEIVVRKNWTPERVLRILKGLEELGVARYDDSYRLGQRWYFPGLKSPDEDTSSF